MLDKLKLIEKNLGPGLSKIIRSISWLMAERIVSMMLSLSVGIYLVRYLGPEKFGMFSYSFSFVYLFYAIAKLGLDQVVVRDLVKEESNTEKILGTAFVLKILGSLFTVILIAICIWYFNSDIQLYWMTVIIAVGLLFDASEVIDFWFQSKVLSGAIAKVKSIQLIFSSLVKVLFIFLKFPLIAFAWLVLVDSITRAIGMFWVYSRHSQSALKWNLSKAIANKLMLDSWPLIFSGVMITIYMKIDQVMLGNMVGNKEVGNYAAAIRFSEIWYFIPVAICYSVFPAIVRAKETSQKRYEYKIQQLYDLLAWIAIAIAIPMTFFSDTLIDIFFGKNYKKCGEILALHIWASPFTFLNVAIDKWLTIENLAKYSFAKTSMGAIANIILNYFFIPKYGGAGAALATLISYAIASHISCLFFPSLFSSGWMLTKALLVPFRFQQNLIYLKQIRKKIYSV